MLGVYRDNIVGAAPAFPAWMEASITAALVPPAPDADGAVAGEADGRVQ